MNQGATNGRLLKITIKTFFGLEEVLKEELNELGFNEVSIGNRSVHLMGTWKDVYFLNIHIRTGISVLVELKYFEIRDEKDLYQQASRVDWTRYFDVEKSFAIKGAVFSDLFRHSQYPFLVIKDAVVDSFRKRLKKRPNVEIKHPDVLIDVYISENKVTLSLNTSGAPLFQRGYRKSVGSAPLNEVVAAGLLRLSGWDKKSPLYDPFCGSGTILTEAALMCANIPPGFQRPWYAFKNLKNYNEEIYQEIRSKINTNISKLPCEISGSDISPEMVTKTRRNLRSFQFGRFINTEVASFNKVKRPSDKGVIVTNPPYGERIGERVEELYADFGDWLKTEMTGWDCWVLSSNIDALKNVGLKASKQYKVFNGSLECSFRKFELYEGSKKLK